MKTKVIKILALMAALTLCVVCATMSVFADSAIMKAVDGTVELDGTNKNTVSISLSAASDMVFELIQGSFSTTENEGSNYFTLVGISANKFEFDNTNYAYDVNTGYLVWMDDTYAGVSYAKDDPVLTAIYEVAANTPAGAYTFSFVNEAYADGDWNEYYDQFEFTITVTTAPACDHGDDKGKGVEYTSNGNGTHNVKVTCDCGVELTDEAEWNVPCFDSNNDKICDVCEATMPCTHANTKLSSNGNGTHNVVCAADGCDHVETLDVPCTPIVDGDCTTDDKCECGYIVTAAKASHTPGADDGDCTTAVKCVNCEKNAVEAKASHTPAEDDGDCTTAVKCVNCEKNAVEAKASHTGGEATCKEKAECAVCGKKYGEFDDDNHASDKVTYTNNDKNHSATYDCCGAAYVTNEAHTYTNHVCVCGYVERFVITMDANGGKFSNGAPVYPVQSAYGTPFDAVPADPTKEGYKFVGWNTKADGTGDDIDLIPGTYTFTADLTVYAQWEVEHVCAHHHYNPLENNKHQSICSCGKLISTEDCSFGATHETACVCGNTYTGWAVVIDGEDGVIEYSIYVVNGQRVRGWTQIGEDWYYLNTMSGYRAEGLYRAPYPKTAINGKTYAPNAEDLAYYNAHKDTSKYTDATYALFVFDQDGKFQQTTGIVNGKHFAVNGCVAWHVGFVEIDGAYYYFAGDTSEEMNGNVMVTGKVYATRDYNTGKAVDGAIYMFGEDGKLIKNAGIVDGYYYNEDNSLAIGAGLVECGDGYIYVRSNGQVVTDAKYWLTASKLADAGITDLKAGMYTFDENGMLVRPQVEPELDGIVEKDGKYYYYVDGVKQAGAGVIEMSDESGTFYIYVTSDGTLATGKYWPTNLNGLLKSGCYDWGTDGKYYPNAN